MLEDARRKLDTLLRFPVGHVDRQFEIITVPEP